MCAPLRKMDIEQDRIQETGDHSYIQNMIHPQLLSILDLLTEHALNLNYRALLKIP